MPIKLRVGEVARQQGLTIKALAARAGIAYNTAHSLATGRATRIDLDTLDRIATALDVEPGSLFVRARTFERQYLDEDTNATPDDQPKEDSDRAARAPDKRFGQPDL
jgi:DNA-binding Xre family transcriptional regulator